MDRCSNSCANSQRRERVSGKKIRKEKESEKRNSRQKKEDQSTRKGGKVAKHCFSIFFPFFPTFWGTHLSYIGFLSWKLPPPPRAVLLVIMTTGSKLREIVNQIIKMVLPCSSCFGPELIAKQIHTGSNLCGAHCRERQHFLTHMNCSLLAFHQTQVSCGHKSRACWASNFCQTIGQSISHRLVRASTIQTKSCWSARWTRVQTII